MKHILFFLTMVTASCAQAMERGAGGGPEFVPGAVSFVFHNTYTYDNQPRGCVAYNGRTVSDFGVTQYNTLAVHAQNCPCPKNVQHGELDKPALVYYDINGNEIKRIELKNKFDKMEAEQAFGFYGLRNKKFPLLDSSVKQKAVSAEVMVPDWNKQDIAGGANTVIHIELILKNVAGKNLACIPFRMHSLEDIKKNDFDIRKAYSNSFLDMTDIAFENIDQGPWHERLRKQKAVSMSVAAMNTMTRGGKTEKYDLHLVLRNADDEVLAENMIHRENKQNITREEFEALKQKHGPIIDTSVLSFEKINQDLWIKEQAKNADLPVPGAKPQQPDPASLQKSSKSNIYSRAAIVAGVTICGLCIYKLYKYLTEKDEQSENQGVTA